MVQWTTWLTCSRASLSGRLLSLSPSFGPSPVSTWPKVMCASTWSGRNSKAVVNCAIASSGRLNLHSVNARLLWASACSGLYKMAAGSTVPLPQGAYDRWPRSNSVAAWRASFLFRIASLLGGHQGRLKSSTTLSRYAPRRPRVVQGIGKRGRICTALRQCSMAFAQSSRTSFSLGGWVRGCPWPAPTWARPDCSGQAGLSGATRSVRSKAVLVFCQWPSLGCGQRSATGQHRRGRPRQGHPALPTPQQFGRPQTTMMNKPVKLKYE